MLVFCLGMPRSGSTWVFNVVRALLADGPEPFVSLYAESGADFAAKCPPGARNVLIKAHAIDQVLVRALDASDATTILTWRDPRDVVASMESLGLGDPLSLARSMSATGSALIGFRDTHPNALTLAYEDGFTGDIDVIWRLANHLGLQPDSGKVQGLFEALDHERLRGELDRWSAGLGEEADFRTHVDPATHWHKDHLGDGRVGKWREIEPAAVRTAVGSALTPLDKRFRDPGAGMEFAWSSEFFASGEGARPKLGAPADAGDPLVLSGPGASLPAGRWRLSFDVELKTAEQVELKVLVAAGALRAAARQLVSEPRSSFWMEFEHREPLATLNVQVTRESAPAKGWIAVTGLRAESLAPLAAPSRASAARPVTGGVTPV